MHVNIVPTENVVRVEGFGETIDCSELLAQEIHAITWYGLFGEVQYLTDLETGARKGNERITDFTPYQKFVDAWTVEALKLKAVPDAT